MINRYLTFLLLPLTLAACGESSNSNTNPDGGSGAVSCEACTHVYYTGSSKPSYCAASNTCTTSDDTTCAYGLITAETDCDKPYLSAPTKLPIDCRKSTNANDMRCLDRSSVMPKTIGTGPSLNLYEYGGGFIDTARNRLVIAFSCSVCSQKDSGVMAIDLTTGNRTLLSGSVQDLITGPQSVGTGPSFKELNDVEMAPNGKWWAVDNPAPASGPSIFEIDPATGNRTVLYTQAQLDQDTGICKDTNVGIGVGANTILISRVEQLNMIVHSDGKIYMHASRAFLPMGGPEIDLEAIVELNKTACRVVTAYSPKDSTLNVGTGPVIDRHYGWLVESKGALVANVNFSYMHSIDIATGKRTMLSSANPSAMLGTGGQIGHAFNLVSPDGSAILTTGDNVPEAFSGFQSVDIATGNRTTLIVAAGSQRNATAATPFVHPTLSGVYIMATSALVTLFEPASGNSYTLSR